MAFEESLCLDRGLTAGARGRDRLTVIGILDVTASKDSRDICFRTILRFNEAVVIKLELVF